MSVTVTGTAIVAGAASGIGLATLRELARTGARCVGVDVRPAPTEVAEAAAGWVQGDVCSRRTWEQALDECQAVAGGPPTVLVFSAGALEVGGIAETPLQDLRELFEVNVFAVAGALQVLLPAMTQAQASAVVVVSSVNGLIAEQNLAAYNMSKGALQQLVQSVAVDYGHLGLRINAVCPSVVDTPMFQSHMRSAEGGASLQAIVDRHPIGRLLEPDDVASAIAFLVSDAARAITGTAVVVDGGLTASSSYAGPR